MREQAQIAGYTVVDASTVVATHINHLIHQHAATLLGRTEVQKLLEKVEKDAPKITEELVPKAVSMVTLQSVLRGLLEEDVPIRDMRAIIEVLLEWGPRLAANAPAGYGADTGELVSRVRQALGRAITQQIFEDAQECKVIGLDAHLERVLTQALTSSGAMEPTLAENLLHEMGLAIQNQEAQGLPTALVVSPILRAALARYFRNPFPHLAVLANTEIPEDRIIKVNVVAGAAA